MAWFFWFVAIHVTIRRNLVRGSVEIIAPDSKEERNGTKYP